MTREELVNKPWDVSIRNRGTEGNPLCFNVHNDTIGDFIISNCYYNAHPIVTPYATFMLNGSVSLELDDEAYHDFVAYFNICTNDDTKGKVLFDNVSS